MDKPITLHRLAQEPYAIPPAPPGCTLVIFGATGDLTARKLVPGLYRLAAEGLLPEAFVVVAFARRPRVVQPILTGWQDKPLRGTPTYAAGTWGPPEATRLLRRDGRRWLSSCDP